MTPFPAGGIYSDTGAPWGSDQPPFDGLDGILTARPTCRIISDATCEWDGTALELIWVLPSEPWSLFSHAADLAHVVAILNAGGMVALHGVQDSDIQASIGRILTLAGGGHA